MYADSIKKVANTHNIIRYLRLEHGLDVSMMSQLFDIQPVLYYKYEEGYIRPSLNFLAKLALLYGVSIDYIIGNTQYSSPYPLNSNLISKQTNLREKIIQILLHKQAQTDNSTHISQIIFMFSTLNRLSLES